MRLILRVSSQAPHARLPQLVEAPLGLDVWEVKPDHLVLSAEEAQAERLQHMGFTVEQLHETEQYVNDLFGAAAAAHLNAYHSVASLEQDLRSLAESKPDIAELREVGRSLEGRPIWALRIGDRHGTDRKLLFLGCHHAREWISVEVPYLLAEHLVNQANQAPISTWLTQGEIWVAPIVNPDGHEFSRVTDRLWRKNRRHNVDATFGVDPNRNYGYMWGVLNVSTSSHVPRDETYVGPRAFSEPETQAMRRLIEDQQFRAVLSYHSYSQLILYPWGYRAASIDDAADRKRMLQLGQRMQQLIQGVHNTAYTVEQASQLYPTAGDTTDWTYGIYGVPSFTIELRPDSQAAGGFILPPEQIQPTWEENRPAALEFISQLL